MEILTQKDLIEKLLKILSTALQKHMTHLKRLLTSLQKMMIFIRQLKKLLQQRLLRKSLKQSLAELKEKKLLMPLQSRQRSLELEVLKIILIHVSTKR
jgi:hypothetical protein